MLFQYCKPLIIRRKENDFDTTQNTLKLGIDILEVLIKLREKGIFHLDIQPKNIYFDNNNKAILGDFSCSSYENELAKLKPGVGTLAFMAPEVYQYGIYGEKSEIYSLGIILYALLNNAKLPFLEEHDTQTALKLRLEGAELPKPHKCSDEIWQCIKKMCEYDHLKRFSTYEDALNTIAKLLNTEKTKDKSLDGIIG